MNRNFARLEKKLNKQAIEICDNLMSDFVDSAAYYKAPAALVVTVLMELLAQSLAQQAANRDDCSEFVESAANALENLTLHAFDRYRGGEGLKQ